MPPSTEILEGLTTIANDARGIALAWHVFLGAFLCSLALGWRPSSRVAGLLLVVPLTSVSALAWAAGNPFNGTVFLALSLSLAGLALRLRGDHVRVGSPVLLLPGVMFVAFAWVYPHFLRTDSWISYLFAAPFGLLPCPTLSAIIGITLIVNLLDSRAWSIALAAIAIMYGVIGVFRLGVILDGVLLAAAAWVGIAAALFRFQRIAALESTSESLQQA